MSTIEKPKNRWEQAARAKKTKALFDALKLRNVSLEDALAYDTIQQESLAAEIGVKSPGAYSWSLVIERLKADKTTPEPKPKEKYRRPLWEMDEVAAMLEPYVGTVEHMWGGSFRRRSSTVGDLDLIVITDGPLSEAGMTGPLANDRPELVQFSTDVTLLDETELQVDVWRCLPSEIGPFMAFVTGPKEWNVVCRSRAMDSGWKLSQHGLVDMDGRRLDDNTESGIFRMLGLPDLTPEQRQTWKEFVK